jgi:hypothetical protein
MPFKVVHEETRFGSNAMGWLNSHSMAELELLLNHYPVLQGYFPVYRKGAIISAVPGSPGILCFESRELAWLFIEEYRMYRAIVIEVEGIGIVDRNPRIIQGCFNTLNLIKNRLKPRKASSHRGVIAFKKVRVLE